MAYSVAVMRRSIDDLRRFYAEPAGALVRRLVARRLRDAWGDAPACDVLGIGYATPWLDSFPAARRALAAMPEGQGAEVWPLDARSRTALVSEFALPFATGSFDRVLLIHALEESDNPQAALIEAARVLRPSGRLIVAVAARGGFWTRSEATPFGHGRPFTRGQVEQLVRGADLTPLAWSQTLYVPPWRAFIAMADSFESFGSVLLPGAAGLILLEAGRQVPALTLPGHRARARPALAPGTLLPQPASGRMPRLSRVGKAP
jgi:SAM-dependent methyltransferase